MKCLPQKSHSAKMTELGLSLGLCVFNVVAVRLRSGSTGEYDRLLLFTCWGQRRTVTVSFMPQNMAELAG